MNTIDLRSDTVTQPTQTMRDAMAKAPVGDAVYNDDPTTLELERLAAELTGKEAALFVPSGVFGNQLALFTHCKSGDEVVLYDDCHIIQHEGGAAAIISRVQTRTLRGPGSSPDAADVEAAIRTDPDDIHQPRTGLICLENAHSDGCVVPLERMRAVREVAQCHGVPVHLDGARLFNAAVHLGVEAKEIAQYADSVMFCLSKGLCAPVGSMLAGSAAFVEAARRGRKVLGGGMRQTGVLAAAGLVALREMTGRLADDHAGAKWLAGQLAAIPGIAANPEEVHINLVFFRLEDAGKGEALMRALGARNILANGPEHGSMRFAVHHGVSQEDLAQVVEVVRGAL